MKKQKKQNLLTVIIILLVIVLAMLVGSIVYEEIINMKKQPIQDTSSPVVKDEEKDTTIENNETLVENEEVDEGEENVEEPEKIEDSENNQEYVGEEETNSQEEITENKDEKAIQAVKKEWGEDSSVTFSIEQKKGNIYYVAVKSESASTVWYEVNIDTWEVSEY